MSPVRFLVGLIISASIGWLAYKRGALSPSGVWGAIITGTVVFGFGGLTWGLVLVVFFVSSSLLSHFRRAQKLQLADKFAKGERRDLGQTLANGGVGALLALAVLLFIDLPGEVRSGNPLYVFLTLAYFGAIATANADTWATELGVLAPSRPRLITTGKEVPAGTSGGVTWQGSLAALAGGTFIGASAFLIIQVASLATSGQLLMADLPVILIAGLAGFLGSMVDSLLGATLQRVYWCDTCQKETERPVHSCGTTTSPRRGWGWLNNDVVNFLASAAGALIGGGLGLLILL
ncbi:MAG: DUF92 domain-containing protein [Chloroflexota bacterium]|nr:DUF92 domain-containing protein [Chloroflexota bacterium]